MPANIKAKCYQWFMTDNPQKRVVAYEWWPTGEFTSSLTLGRLYFKERDDPQDVWGPPIDVASEIPWAAARGYVRREGFRVEVEIVEEVKPWRP